jgi:hypothetical protein
VQDQDLQDGNSTALLCVLTWTQAVLLTFVLLTLRDPLASVRACLSFSEIHMERGWREEAGFSEVLRTLEPTANTKQRVYFF